MQPTNATAHIISSSPHPFIGSSIRPGHSQAIAHRRRHAMRRMLGLMLVVGLAFSQPAAGGDWPAFRGPNGNGFSDEKNVPTTWSTTENVKWKAALPDEGNGSPIVVGDRVFVTCAQEKGKQRGLYCFDRTDGKPKWS